MNSKKVRLSCRRKPTHAVYNRVYLLPSPGLGRRISIPGSSLGPTSLIQGLRLRLRFLRGELCPQLPFTRRLRSIRSFLFNH